MIDTGLTPGYCDVDLLMLHGCFSLLCRFVEDEHGGTEALEEFTRELEAHPDPHAPKDASSSQADHQRGAIDLYRWWKIDRPADLKRMDDLTTLLYSNGKRHMSFVPIEGTKLNQIVFRPFQGGEQAPHAEMRRIEGTASV
jgi:hypothetical protein